MKWDEIVEANHDDVIKWAQSQSWARAMASCAQDAQWHAEGDVWTHTELVCRKLDSLSGWDALSKRDRLILLFVALLHDSAKPMTTTFDQASGRIRSPGHAVKGEKLARNVLRELQADLATRERICRLVRYHGRPAFLAERQDPVHEVVRLSWLAENRLLYLFAIADTRGRQTESMQRPEEDLEYWKLLSCEHGCFVAPYPFASDHARFTFFRQSDPNLHYVPHDDFRCGVTMICGLPGAGKDTWLAKHRPDHPVVALDEIRAELRVDPTDDQGAVIQLATERCREHLRSGTSFAFNATNLLKQTRCRWLDLFADYRARTDLVYLEPPLQQIRQQNLQRIDPVPESVIAKLAAKTEPPDWSEAHQLTVVA